MKADVRTVLWKEYREMFSGPASRDNIAVTIIMLGLLGILMPLQQGVGFVSSPMTLLYSYMIPFTIILNLIADSFAGERERHTLETLLAGRLSDRAILVGKLLASVLYAWAVSIVSLLLGWISVNVAFGKGHLLLFSIWMPLSFVTLSFLVSWLIAGFGVLISLRSPTVRQAQQIVGLMISVPMVPILIVLMMMRNVTFGTWVMTVAIPALSSMLSNVTAFVGVMALVLLIIDLALVRIALARFQRAKLIQG
jgi:ABC-2 type transport system permease protein